VGSALQDLVNIGQWLIGDRGRQDQRFCQSAAIQGAANFNRPQSLQVIGDKLRVKQDKAAIAEMSG
jgi:hypothetical protein